MQPYRRFWGAAEAELFVRCAFNVWLVAFAATDFALFFPMNVRRLSEAYLLESRAVWTERKRKGMHCISD